LKDYQKPKDDRSLKCPVTRNFVNSEVLLDQAGMLGAVPTNTERKHWWEFEPDANWILNRSNNEYLTLEFISDGKIKSRDYYNYLEMLFSKQLSMYDSHIPKINYAYAICNKTLLQGFKFCYQTNLGKSNASKKLGKQDNWKGLPDAAQRMAFLGFLEDYSKRYFWNEKSEMSRSYVPMYQGTNEGAVWSICENGFATVAQVDGGFYGKGIYFTSDMYYAAKYATKTMKGKVIILALTIPGNSYPITENPFKINAIGDFEKITNEKGQTVRVRNPDGFYESGPQDGFQSHYTIVEKLDTKVAFPIKDGSIDTKRHADELVIFQDAQTLPIFVLYLDE